MTWSCLALVAELKSEISQLKVDLRRANDDKEVLEEEVSDSDRLN